MSGIGAIITPTPEQVEAHKKLNKTAYEWHVVADFLCREHNVKDVPFIEPFGRRVYCYEPLRQTEMTVEVKNMNVKFNIRTNDAEGQVINCPFTPNTWLSSAQPQKPFTYNGQTLEHDLSNVMLYSITCKNYRLNVPIEVAPRLNFYHEGMAQLQMAREQDEMFAAAGAIRGAFTILKPVNGGADLDDIPLPELHFAYQNQYFTRTMAYVNERNLMHGLIQIPPDVCVAARLPIWKGMPEPADDELAALVKSLKIDPTSEAGIAKKQNIKEQVVKQREEQFKDSPKISHFVAIPINHVLAWGYRSEEFAATRGHRVQRFSYIAPGGAPVILYYLIDNIQFDSLLAAFKRDWLRKVDTRPLTEAGFQFLPFLKPKYDGIADEAVSVTGAVSMRAVIKFVSSPRLTQATIDNMAPALIPGFPEPSEWSLDGVAQQMAIERQRLAKEKAERQARKK